MPEVSVIFLSLLWQTESSDSKINLRFKSGFIVQIVHEKLIYEFKKCTYLPVCTHLLLLNISSVSVYINERIAIL